MLGQQGNTSTSWESSAITAAALTWHNAGCSLIPVRADRTKKPLIGEWQSYMKVPADREQVLRWFRSMPKAAIAIICGQTSGNLEMLELEGRATSSDHITRIVAECDKRGIGYVFEGFLENGYAEWTPSGGLHLLYRISNHDVPGNQKVARRPATEEEIQEQIDAGTPPAQVNKIKVLSETRGEGGYVVVAPSAGHVYTPNDSWSVCAGTIGTIPTLDWETRNELIAAIHTALDEMPTPAPAAPRPLAASLLPGRSDRPGDDFNNRAQWSDILTPHGWAVHHHAGHTTYWTRPGKETRDGYSATTGRANDGDRLFVFSSSTVFPTEEPVNKFAAYTLLEHHGDFAAAARELGQRGYGKTGPRHGAGTDPAAGVGTLRPPVPAVSAAVAAAAGDTGAGELVSAASASQDSVATVATDWPAPIFPPGTFDGMDPVFLGASRMYSHLYQDLFKWCGDTNRWWYFNGKVWRRDHTERHNEAGWRLIEQMRAQAKESGDVEQLKIATKLANSMTLRLGTMSRMDPRISITSDGFDQGSNICLDNGTFCLDTNTFTAAHDPRQLITKALPVAYDKDAEAPRWRQFMEDVLPDVQMRDYVQRAIGFTLHGSARERALFLLHGQSGTGKSQFIRAMELLFGDHAETASSQAFSAASKTATITNDLNDLRGKRFVALSEMDEDERLNESLLKRLTGGDTAKSRGLYQENSQWRVTFTLWMATNHLPRLNSDDNAVWKRVKPILFPVVQEDTEHGEIKSIAESIFAEEAAGILNWALEGVALYQQHGLGDPPQIAEAVTAYRRDVDTVAQFLEASLDEGTLITAPTAAVSVRQLHGIYTAWAQRNNTRPLGERRFNARIESLGHHRRKQGTYQWQGLGIGSHGLLGTMMRN